MTVLAVCIDCFTFAWLDIVSAVNVSRTISLSPSQDDLFAVWIPLSERMMS